MLEQNAVLRTTLDKIQNSRQLAVDPEMFEETLKFIFALSGEQHLFVTQCVVCVVEVLKNTAKRNGSDDVK
jgi:hypothetical protein